MPILTPRLDYLLRHGHVEHVQRQQRIHNEKGDKDFKAPMRVKLVKDRGIRQSLSDRQPDQDSVPILSEKKSSLLCICSWFLGLGSP